MYQHSEKLRYYQQCLLAGFAARVTGLVLLNTIYWSAYHAIFIGGCFVVTGVYVHYQNTTVGLNENLKFVIYWVCFALFSIFFNADGLHAHYWVVFAWSHTRDFSYNQNGSCTVINKFTFSHSD